MTSIGRHWFLLNLTSCHEFWIICLLEINFWWVKHALGCWISFFFFFTGGLKKCSGTKQKITGVSFTVMVFFGTYPLVSSINTSHVKGHNKTPLFAEESEVINIFFTRSHVLRRWSQTSLPANLSLVIVMRHMIFVSIRFFPPRFVPI